MRKPISLWDIVCKYVKENHPNVPIDPENVKAGGYRFRVKVLKNNIEITDAGASPGMKAPADFPRQIIPATDKDIFKKISKVCKYRGKGGVVVYRDRIRKYGNKTVWTSIQGIDYTSLHGVDLETQLIHNMAADIQKEIDEAIIKDLTTPLDVGDVMPPKSKKRKK